MTVWRIDSGINPVNTSIEKFLIRLFRLLANVLEINCLVLRSTRLHDVHKKKCSCMAAGNTILDIIVYQYPNIWNSVSFIIFLVTYMDDYSYYRYILVFIKTLFIQCSSEFSSSQLFRSLFLVWGSLPSLQPYWILTSEVRNPYKFISYTIHPNELVFLSIIRALDIANW